ncbi:MAG: transposase [Elusimicrobia bacterium]|nr:transposase [Elusimicrobiota bacterium]MBU2614024.1 transposase [Elusimicrobiota bacterium]
MANIVQELEFTDKYLFEQYLFERWSQVKEDFWGDLKLEQERALKRLLETSMEIEVQDLIGCGKWGHNKVRPIFRNGFRYRSLLSTYEHLANIKVPRIRSGRMNFSCIAAYSRRAPDVDHTILEMFLNGVSTRKVSEVLEPLFGMRAISAAGVSRITKSLNNIVNKHHARSLSDDYIYLIADGVYFNVKNPILKKRRCVLVVYGIKSTGKRELIDFQLASHGESQQAWELFFNRLYITEALKANT